MPNIFISYRRDDSPASARLIRERLREWFGDGHSFMDVEQIELGDDWKHVVDQRVSRCVGWSSHGGARGGPQKVAARPFPGIRALPD